MLHGRPALLAPSLIAVDWGTSRVRAYRIAGGRVVERRQSDDGVSAVPPGGHAAALDRLAGGWMAADPALPVLLVGMIGSRNGWLEAPYLPAPCGPAEVAAARISVPGSDRAISIIPGVEYRDRNGAPDVMRGEETLAFGAGVVDGVICLPGTHSKWVEVAGGRVVRFATFVTGELYGVLCAHAFLARLAEEPEDAAGFSAGLAAAPASGGVMHHLFEARSRVLAGDMRPAAVRPFLSGLLIGTELNGAAELFDTAGPVHLVAEGALADAYLAALAQRGIAARPIDPERALIGGLLALGAGAFGAAAC